jgi:hypothetical protein
MDNQEPKNLGILEPNRFITDPKLVENRVKLIPTTELKCFPNKQGFIEGLHYTEVCNILGFKDNYTEWEDTSMIRYS